ncbi:HET-domain-containing protein [Mycena venus]|uniref:HET-domain-containing protein n=1 Tax=Mycena venus TaxID=2733690 RepID=A0A8H7D4I8_9AGAR|nr:HET-domain-containing protein [Mycena venus]
MSGEVNEFKTFIANVSGGTGGMGGMGSMMGGGGGIGQGPTVNYHINAVGNLTTNNSGGSLVVHNDRLKEVLGKWLEFPPETKDRQYHLRSLHHKDTGHWLLHDCQFAKWKATPGSLWIKGISGTGKSVLSSTVIEDITMACPKQSAVAYFYFYFSKHRQRMDIMVRSIIWQLSGWSSLPYSALHQLYETLGNGTIHPQHVHLQGVLEDLLSELDQTYIVIDGLDECHKTDWKPLVQFIHSLQHPTKNALHLLFTSQPLQEFQIAFKDVNFIELGSAITTGNIRSFVGSEILGVGNWTCDDKDTMFCMAACLLIELRGCYFRDDVEETLRALPADLFGIYCRFLTWGKDSLKQTVFIQAIFRWLVFSARKLTPEELADAIAFRLSDPEFDFFNPAKSIHDPKRRLGNSDIFKLSEGLIVIKHDGSDKPSITLAHSSVKDYILSPHFQQEFGAIIDLTKDISHKFIAQTCVRYLLLFADAQHLMTGKTLLDYPISLYAAEYWFHHLQLCDSWDQEALLPSTMHLLEDGSSQYAALYQLRPLPWYMIRVWHGPISPAVCMCSKIGYTAGVQSLLIKHSTSVDQADKDGRAALHQASSEGHLDTAQLLIEHSASVDQPDKDGCTALHLASSKGHLNIVQLLIECNASVDQADKDGRAALHKASSQGYPNIVQLLLEHNTSVNQADKDGRTALHLASSKGHLDIMQLLTECNASVNQADTAGWTVLHLASSKGHLDIVQLLIECSISFDQADTAGWTALHHALSKGHLNVAQLLIEHSTSVDQADKYGWTALHHALRWGHLNIVQLIIEHSASVDQADKHGWTALHLALSKGHYDIAQQLIECSASVDQADKDGWTALHLASSKGCLNIVQLLIEHGASVDQADKDGWTALHLAWSKGHLDIAQLLIECSASVDQTFQKNPFNKVINE